VVKVYYLVRQITPSSNDIEEVEEVIHDCRYPSVLPILVFLEIPSLPGFIGSVEEVVESRRSSVF